VMSKRQQKLTNDEGKFWADLAESQSKGMSKGELKSVILALADESHVVSTSYDRRNNPATSSTFRESKEILQALGVPCIVPRGAFEAEALASSLVREGYADFVVSEDTDVLIYEVPMIRNLTRRDVPLVLVSGRDVRSRLSLDRSAFIDLALLMGTDFSPRLRQVGPTRALKLIHEHGSIEQVLEHAKYRPRVSSEEYLQQVVLARRVYSSLPAPPRASALKLKPPNEENISTVLRQYGLLWATFDESQSKTALSGNFYGDDPGAS